MIETVESNEGLSKTYKESYEKNIIKYFSLDQIQRIWSKKTLISSIKYYNETGKLRGGIIHKFETMMRWLIYLGVLQKNNEIELTKVGNITYNELLKMKIDNQLSDRTINKISLFLVDKNLLILNVEKEYQLIKKLYLDSIKKFTNEEGFGDLIAINKYVFIKIALDHSYYLNENNVEIILSRFQQDNYIRSFILNRQGKLAFIQMK